jgi:reverse gyrase
LFSLPLFRTPPSTARKPCAVSLGSVIELRRSTFGIPRVVGCAELLSRHIALPRGCREAMEGLLAHLSVALRWRDERNMGQTVEASFLGELTTEQETALAALLQHETEVLAATTGFGKTVVAAAILAARKTNTLILVHRRQLMEQWAARLQSFLSLPKASQKYLKFQLLRAACSNFCVGYPRMALVPPVLRST